MRTLNKVQLIGRLGKEPEIQRFDGDSMVARFPLATNESYKDKNGNLVETTDWHNVVAWRGLAKISENFLKKGSSIYVEGKIRSRSYDDKDGNKRYVIEIVADNFIMLDKKEDGIEGVKTNTPATPKPENIVEEDGSDLPF